MQFRLVITPWGRKRGGGGGGLRIFDIGVQYQPPGRDITN